MRNQGLGSWPVRRARMTPDRTAVVSGDGSLTYARLHERVLRLANGLRGLGVAAGDRVAYLGPNQPSFLETLFACGALGAVFVPLNFRLSGPELEFIVRDAGARLVVRGPGFPELPGPAVQLGAPFEDLIASSPAEALDEPVDLGEPCM